MFTSPEIGKLLDEAEPWAEEQGYDSIEAAFVRVVRRDYDKVVRVPPELAAEMLAHGRGRRARFGRRRARNSDWAMFQPYLEKVIELRRGTSSASSRRTRTTTSCSTTTSRA